MSGPQYVRVSAGPHVQLIQLVVRSGPSRISWHRQRRLRSAQQRHYVQTRLHCLRSRITNGEQVSRVEGVGGTPLQVFDVLAYVNPCGRFRQEPMLEVASHNLPNTWVVVAQACGGQNLSKLPNPNGKVSYESHVYFAAMDLRAKDVEISKPKRERGKQAANTCIDRYTYTYIYN